MATITPVASSAATLGVTSQPALTTAGTSTGGGNAAVNTGYNSTPVTGGGPTSGQQLQTIANNSVAAAQNRISSLGATPATGVNPQTIASNAAAITSQQFGAPMASNLATGAGGGPISDALQNGVAKIAAFAQNGIKSIEQAIQGDMAANNGQVDPAKMQQYTMQMSTFEMIMQMAAKIQEKQERAAQVWLQL
jgi:hypothetical protein